MVSKDLRFWGALFTGTLTYESRSRDKTGNIANSECDHIYEIICAPKNDVLLPSAAATPEHEILGGILPNAQV